MDIFSEEVKSREICQYLYSEISEVTQCLIGLFKEIELENKIPKVE